MRSQRSKYEYPPAHIAQHFDPTDFPELDPMKGIAIGVVHRAVIDYQNELLKPRETRDFAFVLDVERNLHKNPFVQFLGIDVNAVLEDVRKEIEAGRRKKRHFFPHGTFKGKVKNEHRKDQKT